MVSFPDSPESVRAEAAFFFPEFDVDGWCRDQEPAFRTRDVHFCPTRTIHYVGKPEEEVER